MGASQEKRRRSTERVDGTDKRKQAMDAAAKKKSFEKTRNAIIGVAILLLIVAILVLNSDLFYTSASAVKIGDKSYSIAEVSYYYHKQYAETANSEYAAYFGLDTSKPLDDQICAFDESMTWHEYFKNGAIDTLKSVTAMLDAAVAEGYTLSQAGEDNISAELASLETGYAQYGYQSANQFLVAQFGRGVTTKVFEKIIRDYQLASEYAVHKNGSFTFTDDEIEAHYTEKKNDFDVLRYRLFQITSVVDEENNIDEAAAMVIADEAASNVAAAKSEEEFLTLCGENAAEGSAELYNDPSYSLKTKYPNGSLSEEYSEWLLDPARVAGDIEKVESGNGYVVLYFLERDDNHYNPRNVRHILIDGELTTPENSEVSEEDAREEAKGFMLPQAESLYDEWKAGEATEDSFAELANSNSRDPGSNTNGGLYENVTKWTMVPEFNDFLFDPAKKPGDTGIVYGQTSSYFGYHIMYYVGEAEELYSTSLSRSDLQNAAYTEWETAELEKYTPNTGFPLRFVGK